MNPGESFSHFRILERLGAGGMGVVCKALDTALNRLVAIKVLATESVSDPERRSRFIQEAQAASALDHPNIITIYDIAEVEGQYVIAMLYVEGKTLDELQVTGAPVTVLQGVTTNPYFGCAEFSLSGTHRSSMHRAMRENEEGESYGSSARDGPSRS